MEQESPIKRNPFFEKALILRRSLQWYNPVTVTLFRMPPFHVCGHEGAAELLHPDARERARLTLAQQGDELGKGNGQGLFTRTGGTEVAGECFLPQGKCGRKPRWHVGFPPLLPP